MQTEIYTSTVIPLGEGTSITYSLTCDRTEIPGPLGYEIYGVKVDMGEESAVRPRLTVSRNAVSGLLEKLARGGVTPVALNDVVDDWLAY
jgi:hypothetical protein